MELKVEPTASRRRAIKQRGRNRGVGGDEAEHRRHIGLDHARTFRAAQERALVCRPMRQRAAAHFGRVSVVMMARANSSKAAASALRVRAKLRHGGENFFHAQRRADHAGGANQNLRRIDAAQLVGEL